MGLFDKLFSKNKVTNTNTNILVPNIIKAETSLVDILNIHPDIRDLVWIGDGKNKNYIHEKYSNSVTIDGLRITMSFMDQEEPSLLYLKLPITTMVNPLSVERPPYYPTYKDLTPTQKGVYWNLLANPYNSSIDIGFVFILYYGLERHLLSGNFEKAFDVILRLRDVHTNKSFQNYSGNALILTCIYHQNPNLALKFMESLNKDYEYNFSDNLFLLLRYSLNSTLNARDIIRMAKSFEFTTLNYIKNYPDIFTEVLEQEMEDKYNSKEILCNTLVSKTEFSKLKKQNIPVFANVSIFNKSIDVPMIVESFKLKKAMNDLLCDTHEKVKKLLAEQRKSGTLRTPEPNKNKEKEVLSFDFLTEKDLLKNYTLNKNHYLDLHFSLIALQDFYYKYRNLDQQYLDKCIQYCNEDLENLERMQSDYYNTEVTQIKSLSAIYGNTETQNRIREIQKFNGNIPAFKRLAIIYEKQKEFSSAMGICEKAINYYSSMDMIQASTEFIERNQKIISKIYIDEKN